MRGFASQIVVHGPSGQPVAVLRDFALRTGASLRREMLNERRNLIDDYASAFGQPPDDAIYGIAIFTDNDDTLEPIVAHYGKINLVCNLN